MNAEVPGDAERLLAFELAGALFALPITDVAEVTEVGALSAVPMLVLLVIGFFGPLALVVLYSFMPRGSFSPIGQPTLENYVDIIEQSFYISFGWSLFLSLVSVAILAVTSFGALRLFGELRGWTLMVHMVGAGMFVFSLPVLAIVWFEPNRSGSAKIGGQSPREPRRFEWFPRLMFWIETIVWTSRCRLSSVARSES